LDVLHTFAFFEAYFSNFIEGTEFEVDDAYQVVFQGLQIAQRSQDRHDILNTFRVVVDTPRMSHTPATADELLVLLREHHRSILEHRPDKNPGQFKSVPNRAGSSRFVEPTLVEGTLKHAFDLYKALPHALARAIFIQVLVSEVHPFDDGNGRLCRIMMNAELAAADECRIIIPTVYRDDYMTVLKAFSQTSQTDPVVRMFSRAQAFSASMDWSTYQATKASLTAADAFKESREGKLHFVERRLRDGGPEGISRIREPR